MNGITDGQEKALGLLLLNFAAEEDSSTWETIAAIPSVLGCDREQATLRDQFAMAALTGLLSNTDVDLTKPFPVAAKICYGMADAMLDARKVTEGTDGR